MFEAIHKKSQNKVAIKRLNKIFDDAIDCKRILREIKLLRALKSQYIVKLYDILEPDDYDNFDTIYLVMEYA